MPSRWYELPPARQAAERGDYGRLLRLARIALKLSQREAGAMAGFSAATISRYETGYHKHLDVGVLHHLARTFGIPPAMFGLTGGDAHNIPGRSSIVPPEDGDRMRRRDLLQGIATATGMSVLMPVPAAAGATSGMDRLLVGSSEPAAHPLTLARMSQLIADARQAFTQCRYRELAAHLPGLIQQATATRDAMPHDSRTRADALLSRIYGVATDLLTKLHENGAAWATADRAMRAARASGEPRVLADSQRLAAIVIRRSAHPATAQEFLITSARRFASDTQVREAKDASLYARMLCTASYTAAMADDRSAAHSLMQEARDSIARSGSDGFAINDIDLYAIGISRALGDFGHAVTYVRNVRLDLLGPSERQARYWEDSALAWWGRGRPELSFQAMLHAEKAAPQEVRYRPWAQHLTLSLLSTGQTVGLSGLRDFATRIGVHD